jgi:septum formation protein
MRLRIPFDVIAPHVDETPLSGESPQDLARRLAHSKALAVAQAHPKALVIGSDQVVNLVGECLGKPGNHEKAIVQLRKLSGQIVSFETAVSVISIDAHFKAQELVSVKVKFRDLEDSEIESYLRAETPYDCAGSAKSEGLGITLLEFIQSDDPTALIGLPLISTCNMLRQASFKLN